MLKTLLLAACLVGSLPLAARAAPADPLGSVRWEDMRAALLDGAEVRFDARVVVSVPPVAENPLQVPVTVDAAQLTDVREVRVFADFNPITEILRFYPEAAPARLGFRVKLQQSSPIRAAARTGDDVWHVGGAWVTTTGGGCTAPSFGSANTEWQTRLNEVSGRQWSTGPQAGRLRLRIVHPMDTGLVAGIPAFHLEELTLTDSRGQRLMRLKLYEPVSENPVFTLGRDAAAGAVEVSGRDNNGNRVSARIE